MKQLLQPIEGLTFDETSHRYRFKGRWLHTSPTGVLSVGQDANAKKRIEETRHIWEPRGNTCHLWLDIISLLVLPSLMLAITPTGLHRSRNAGCSKEQRHWHQS